METILTEGLVFLSDLTGFNRLIKDLDLADGVEIIQEFARITWKHVEKASGTLIKYMGDSALGYFPSDRVDEGVMALMDMQREIEEDFTVKGRKTGLRIGAHYGPFALCSFTPFDDMPDLVGDTVNIASRISDLTPGGKVWIGEDTMHGMDSSLEVKPLPPAALKGKDKTVNLYEVAGYRVD